MIRKSWVTKEQGFEIGSAVYVDPTSGYGRPHLFIFGGLPNIPKNKAAADFGDEPFVVLENHTGVLVAVDPHGWFFPVLSREYAYFGPGSEAWERLDLVAVKIEEDPATGGMSVYYLTTVPEDWNQAKGYEVILRPEWSKHG